MCEKLHNTPQTLEGICSPVREELRQLEGDLLALVPRGGSAILGSVAAILRSGGKRLRPALLLMTAKACGYTGDVSVRLAAVVELVHSASLIHDDTIDNAGLRRGAATVNSRWGNRAAVLAGDYLYARAIGILAEFAGPEAMRCVAGAAAHMVESEMVQAVRRKDTDITEDEYLSIIAGKTASLISCSCRVGAMLGEGANGEVDILGAYGRDLGMAFQIADDLLDLGGEERLLGKALGNDIREGRLTLPFIHAMRVAGSEEREWIEDAFREGRLGHGDLVRMREVVARNGGTRYSLEKAQAYVSACKERLRSLRESSCRESLASLADYVLSRAR